MAVLPTSTAAALFEAHTQAELNSDLAGTMATMVDASHLLKLASGTGGQGADGVAKFYATQLIDPTSFFRLMWSSSPPSARWMESGW